MDISGCIWHWGSYCKCRNDTELHSRMQFASSRTGKYEFQNLAHKVYISFCIAKIELANIKSYCSYTFHFLAVAAAVVSFKDKTKDQRCKKWICYTSSRTFTTICSYHRKPFWSCGILLVLLLLFTNLSM